MSDSISTRPAAPMETAARLSIGMNGATIPVREHRHFQLDHALARDAVHTALDTGLLVRGLQERAGPGAPRAAAVRRCLYSLLPVVQNARVAIADHIGALLRADITVLLIGERPGLSAPTPNHRHRPKRHTPTPDLSVSERRPL